MAHIGTTHLNHLAAWLTSSRKSQVSHCRLGWSICMYHLVHSHSWSY